MRIAAAIALFFLLYGCGSVTYPDEQVTESIQRLLTAEYALDDVGVTRDGAAVWLHVPVEKIYSEGYGIDEKTSEIIRRVSLVATRVLFSSDSDIEFVCMYVSGSDGLELRMVRHIEDIRKAQAWYISNEDFYLRSEISVGYNPVFYGKKAVKSMAGADVSEIEKNIQPDKRRKLRGAIPRFDEVKDLKALRTDENKALVYILSLPGPRESLFIVNTEFDQEFKNLMLLLQAFAGGDLDIQNLISLPVISGYRDLSDGMPEEYKHLGEPYVWNDDLIFSRPVTLDGFIARQIKRRVIHKFEEKKPIWGFNVAEIEVDCGGGQVNLMRRIVPESEGFYDVDPDYEIALTVSKVLKNYETDLEEYILYDFMWNEIEKFTREELEEMKPKKWERIRRPGEPTLAEIITSLFLPGFTAPSQEIE